jgi:hypothetical protein
MRPSLCCSRRMVLKATVASFVFIAERPSAKPVLSIQLAAWLTATLLAIQDLDKIADGLKQLTDSGISFASRLSSKMSNIARERAIKGAQTAAINLSKAVEDIQSVGGGLMESFDRYFEFDAPGQSNYNNPDPIWGWYGILTYAFEVRQAITKASEQLKAVKPDAHIGRIPMMAEMNEVFPREMYMLYPIFDKRPPSTKQEVDQLRKIRDTLKPLLASLERFQAAIAAYVMLGESKLERRSDRENK